MQQSKGTGNFGSCAGCGQRVIWIKTTAGKNMPCNPELLNYKLGGSERVVTPAGTVVAATTGVPAGEADGVGYISHFATCKKRGMFRK